MAVNCSDITDINDHEVHQTVRNLRSQVTGELAKTGISIMEDLLLSAIRQQGDRCTRLPVSPNPVVAQNKFEYQHPSLLISGELDPIAPETNAVIASKTLGSTSRLVLFPGLTHGVSFDSSCARNLIATFFEKRKTDRIPDCTNRTELAFPAGDGLVLR